jgi:rhodanese-related sulfurtransferase
VLADGFGTSEEDATWEGDEGAVVGSIEEGASRKLKLDWTRNSGSEMSPLEWHRHLSSIKAARGSKGTAPGAAGIQSGTQVQVQTQVECEDAEAAPLILDCRNSFESDVGIFEGAVPLNTSFFRESWPVLTDLLKGKPKDTPIYTYCTGGIRCVKVNAFLEQQLGFTNTHRLEGGIIAYTRELENAATRVCGSGDASLPISATTTSTGTPEVAPAPSPPPPSVLVNAESLFRGVNYVFDERIASRITEDVLTSCEHCGESCDAYTNCLSYYCNVCEPPPLVSFVSVTCYKLFYGAFQ